MGDVSASIVDPLLQLLKSLHSEVQHEGTYMYMAYINTMHIHHTYVHVCIVMSFSYFSLAGLLIQEILKYEEIHQPLLLGLVTLLKPENVSKTKTNGRRCNT